MFPPLLEVSRGHQRHAQEVGFAMNIIGKDYCSAKNKLQNPLRISLVALKYALRLNY